LNGRAILYADRETGSMKKAIDETQRRREKQAAHNLKYGIEPKGLEKSVIDIMEGAVVIPGSGKTKSARSRIVDSLTENEVNSEPVFKQIAKLEDEMYKAAKDLDFEKAATLRDRISTLKHSQN
jgi:excinuclease ABC subunit B